MGKTLEVAAAWKRAGIATLHESASNNIYLYRDDKSYISISRDGEGSAYYAAVTFTEIRFEER